VDSVNVRGFVLGTVALAGLELLSRRTDQAAGALGWGLALFRSALAPDVPALHYHGHWRPTGQDTVKGGTVTGSLGPAQATVIAGLNAQPPASPA
jgi:hypothetical protein